VAPEGRAYPWIYSSALRREAKYGSGIACAAELRGSIKRSGGVLEQRGIGLSAVCGKPKLVQHLLAGLQYEDRAGVIGVGETAEFGRPVNRPVSIDGDSGGRELLFERSPRKAAPYARVLAARRARCRHCRKRRDCQPRRDCAWPAPFEAASALAINAAALATHDHDFSRLHSLRVLSVGSTRSPPRRKPKSAAAPCAQARTQAKVGPKAHGREVQRTVTAMPKCTVTAMP